jgi:hypothetical protein
MFNKDQNGNPKGRAWPANPPQGGGFVWCEIQRAPLAAATRGTNFVASC